MSTDDHPNLDDLDALFGAGRITADEYWDARLAAEQRAADAPAAPPSPLREYVAEQAAEPEPEPDAGLIAGPPGAPARPAPPPQHAVLVPPPPPPAPGPPQWVRLPFDAPARDAAPTRAGGPRRRRRFRRGG